MNDNFSNIKASIPPSKSDGFLLRWGYDLLDDYLLLLKETGFDKCNSIFEFATGSGRMTAILTRLNFNVITGDLSFSQFADAEKRITYSYFHKVKYIRLNLESIPFAENSIDNIICVNTVHHLDNPVKCVKELIRIHSGKGKMLLADFNDEGFDVMDRLHKVRYGNIHPRGSNNWNEIINLLTKSYSSVKVTDTQLNTGFISKNKI